MATWDYLPNSVREAQAELKNFLLTGKTLEGGFLHIENLTINVFKDNAQDSSIPATRTSISGVISSEAVWSIRHFYPHLSAFIPIVVVRFNGLDHGFRPSLPPM